MGPGERGVRARMRRLDGRVRAVDHRIRALRPRVGPLAPREGRMALGEGPKVPREGGQALREGPLIPREGAMVPRGRVTRSREGPEVPREGAAVPREGATGPREGAMAERVGPDARCGQFSPLGARNQVPPSSSGHGAGRRCRAAEGAVAGGVIGSSSSAALSDVAGEAEQADTCTSGGAIARGPVIGRGISGSPGKVAGASGAVLDGCIARVDAGHRPETLRGQHFDGEKSQGGNQQAQTFSHSSSISRVEGCGISPSP
jgi:hypothetical protein